MVMAKVKEALQTVLAATGRHRWPSIRGGELVVATYHCVLPPDHSDRHAEKPGMVIEPETFKMHLKTMGTFFEFVRLDEWVHRTACGQPLPKNACAITFDDGWLDNDQFAFPILQRL